MTVAPHPDGIAGFNYAIGVSVAIILLITALTLVSYFCTRYSTTTATFVLPQSNCPPPAAAGLDDAVLTSFPKLLYSEANLSHGDSTATSCSICLADYKDCHVIRVLPDCGHFFHLRCVDPWLRLHPTCPVCRTSSPLAKVVPPPASDAVTVG